MRRMSGTSVRDGVREFRLKAKIYGAAQKPGEMSGTCISLTTKKTGGVQWAPPISSPRMKRGQTIVDSESKLNVSTVGFPDITGRSALSSCGYVVDSYLRDESMSYQTLMARTCWSCTRRSSSLKPPCFRVGRTSFLNSV